MILPSINAKLYKCFIHNTITNELFHIVFILIEYLLGTFPLILSSTNQMLYLHKQYEYSYIENSFALITKIKFFVINNNHKAFNSIYLSPFILFFILSTILFFILNHYYSKTDEYTYLDKIVVTFYNVFFFRYLNLFFIDIEIYSSLNLILANDRNLTTVLCGFVLCGYCLITMRLLFYYVDNFSLYLNIDNKAICNKKISYPFGIFVITYENSNLILKMLLCVSNNVFELNNKKVNFSIFILNILIIILSIFNTVSFLIRYWLRTVNVFSIMTWIKSNTLRKIILLFTFFVQFFTICFQSNSTQNQCVIMFLSLICSAVTVSYVIDRKFIYEIIKQPENNLCDLLIFLMSIETPYHPCLDNSNNGYQNVFEQPNSNINVKQTLGYKGSIIKAITSLFSAKPTHNSTNNSKNNQHINISNNKNNDGKWNYLFNNLMINHISQCKKGKDCEICRKMKNKDKHYTLYQIMIWFFREDKQEKRTIEYNQKSANNEYILQIMYSKIKKDIYNTVKYYIMFLHDEHLNVSYCLSNSMTLLFNAFMESSHKQSNLYIHLSIQMCDFSKELNSLIHNFLTFINEDLYTKTSERVIAISSDITNIKKRFLDLYNHFDKKENLGISENGLKLVKTRDNHIRETRKKNLFSVLKYQFTLERFVIESMFNQPFENLSSLNIEVLDEYLDYHYTNDKLCILEVKLHNSRNNQLQLVKLTGFPKENNGKRMFYEYFPKQIREQGIDELLKVIKSYNKENNYQKEFDFIIEKEGFIEYFQYNFEIAEMLIKESILIYGTYCNLYENIILLNFSKCYSIDQLEEVEICHFSEKVGKLLLIKPDYIYAINQSNSFKLGLGHFFREICSDDSPRSTIVHEIHPENIGCFIDYYHLHLKIEPLLTSLSSCYYSNYSEEKEIFDEYLNYYRETISKFTSKQSKVDKLFVKQTSHHHYLSIKKVYLTKIMDLNRNYVLYNVNVPIENSKRRNSVAFTGTVNTNNETKNESQFKTNIEYDNDFHTITGTDSLEQNSISSIAINSFAEKEQVEEVSFKFENLIQRESKQLFILKLITLFLHIFLFIFCFTFLIIQIINANELKLMTNIFFKYSRLKADFSNIFCTFLSLLCITDLHPDHDEGAINKCFNPMKNFSETHLQLIHLQNYSVIDYFLFENKRKIEYISNNYYELTEIIYQNKFKQLDTLIHTNVTYISLQQIDYEIIQRTIYIPFDEAFKMYLSSMRFIFQTKEKGIGYEELPISLITFQNQTIIIKDLLHQNTLSHLQMEIYLKLINYIHFAEILNTGENIIKDRLFYFRNLNVSLIWIFIVLMIILHCVITYINHKNIHITYELYCKILFFIFIKIEEKETKLELNSKIESLLLLSQLYSRKPTPLINNVLTIQRKTAQKHKKIKHKASSSHISTGNRYSHNQDTIEQKQIVDINFHNTDSQAPIITYLFKDKSYTMKHFYNIHIRHLIFNNITSSIFYIIVTIIIDVILILYFEEVFGYFNYSLTIFTFSSLIYTDTSLIHIKFLLNITDLDYTNLFVQQIPLSEENALVEHFLQETLHYYTLKMKAAEQNNIIDSVKIIPAQCREFYEKIKDFVFEDFKIEYNISDNEMLDFLTSICEFEKLMNLKTLYFSFENSFTMMSSLDNKYNRTINGMIGFLNDSELYHVYINVYFFLRPYLQYFASSILTPTILGKFKNYLIIVWIFLVMNILFEILSFLINRFFIVKHLDIIKQYLIQFEKCIY